MLVNDLVHDQIAVNLVEALALPHDPAAAGDQQFLDAVLAGVFPKVVHRCAETGGIDVLLLGFDDCPFLAGKVHVVRRAGPVNERDREGCGQKRAAVHEAPGEWKDRRADSVSCGIRGRSSISHARIGLTAAARTIG